MKIFRFLLTGILFGVVLVKSELISWFRWQEAMRFDSIFFYSMFIVAAVTGIISFALIKFFKIKDIDGHPMAFKEKERKWLRHILGGFVFGLCFVMVGCPGSQYALIGQGNISMIIVFLCALAGTFLYGVTRKFLLH